MSTLKLPKIIGHRGVYAYAPENTLEGIHTAADMNVEWVELDVKLTQDQVPVLFHDEGLERTTNGYGLIADTTYDDLKQLEAGAYFADSYAGIKIPTLEEAIDVLLDRDIGLNLELKPCPGREEETAEVALDLLSHYWDAHEKLYISSYKVSALETVADMAPGWATGLVMGYHSDELLLGALKEGYFPKEFDDYIKTLDLQAISIDQELASDDIIHAIQERGLIPIPYNVNDAGRAHALQILGVEHVISDAPDVVEDGIFTVH